MYLIDTNILIYYLDGNQQVIDFIDTHDAMAISIISVVEVLSYPYNPEEKAIVLDFFGE